MKIQDTSITHEPRASVRYPKFGKTIGMRHLALALALGIGLNSCGSTSNSTKETTVSNTQVLEKADPFVVLDEQAKAGNIDPRLIEERLDAARQQWLRALAAQQRNDKTAIVQHFEEAIDILNRLISYPEVNDNKDFQELTQSVIDDYDKFVAKIDSLPSNASVFALKKKFDEEMGKMDVKNVPLPRDLSKTTIELTMNTPVEQTIAYFTQGNGRAYMSKWLARTGKYFPMMKQIMKEEGVPEELIHLAMIESGLNPNAVSWAKAVGMWQFIDATGSRYGLTNNWWLDKRREPVTATRAAARHLRDLYDALGDWHLALAAYNSGINRVRSAMSQAGSNNFWEIRQYLPKETQNYVPLFIAATRITMDPGHYGFNSITPEKPLAYDTVYVKEAIDFSALSKAAGVSTLEIKELNPDLLQTSTPPVEVCGENGYCLKLPQGTAKMFTERLALISPAERRPWLTHIVQRGETVNSIARTYGITRNQLADYNDLSSNSKLRRGMRIKIPMSVMAPQTGISNTVSPDRSEPSTAREASSRLISHKVKRGETLYSIASKYDVRVADLLSWNRMRSAKSLRSGQMLKIRKVEMASKSSSSSKGTAALSASKQNTLADRSSGTVTAPKGTAKAQNASAKKWTTYKIRRGDTMGKIADALEVNLRDLKTWNKKQLRNGIKAGQTLKVYTSADIDLANAGEEANPELSAPPKFHTVRSGETMTSIARMYGTSVDKIAEWNNTTPGSLQAGQKIKIYAQNKTASMGDRPADQPAKHGRHRVVSYRVKRGDTLAEIANKYGVTVGELKSANRLHSNKLSVGKRLVIPND